MHASNREMPGNSLQPPKRMFQKTILDLWTKDKSAQAFLLLLDFVTAWFSLAAIYLLFGSDVNFIYLAFVSDIRLLPYFLVLAFLLGLIRVLRFQFPESPVFQLLPGFAASLYVLLTLFSDPPASYCIGIVFVLSVLLYLCFPAYKKIWEKQNNGYRICAAVQAVLLLLILTASVFLVCKKLPALPADADYTGLFGRITGIFVILLCAAAVFFSGNYLVRRVRFHRGSAEAAITLFALLNFVLLGGLLTARVSGLLTSTYDMGIFSQMFHYMSTTGQALTTLERNELLLHFSVHLSPVFYLLLPFYMLFPRPETLQILQVLVVLSGLLPLLLLCRHMGLKKYFRVVLSFLYLFHPAIVGASFYDLHENCFLAPLILWLLYFLEKDAKFPAFLAALLLLTTKEDAAMYVVVIGLFMLISGKRKESGLALVLFGSVYFAFAVSLLGAIGEKAQFDRYDNLVADRSRGIAGILITVLTDPGYFLNQLFIPGKLTFLFTTLPALGFIPVLQRRCSRLILLVPLVVMNLMSAYPYQYSLIFHYHYAVTVLLLYTVILFLADTDFAVDPAPDDKPIPEGRQIGAVRSRFGSSRKSWVGIALCFAVISCSWSTYNLFEDHYYQVTYLAEDGAVVESIRTELDKIPRDASIQASTLFTTYLSDRDEVYDLDYNQKSDSPHVTDYVAVDLRLSDSETTDGYIRQFLSEGYAVTADIPFQVLILKKT